MRACPDCGTAEDRRVFLGRESTNLDPVSGRCISCLVKWTRSEFKPMPELPADWAKRAAGDVE